MIIINSKVNMINNRLLKHRKGAAIEFALVMVLIILALCILIISVTMTFKSGVNNEYKLFDKNYKYSKVADEFANYIKTYHPSKDNATTDQIEQQIKQQFGNNYCFDVEYKRSENTFILKLYKDLNNKDGDKTDENLVLTIEVYKGNIQSNNAQTKITSWKFN